MGQDIKHKTIIFNFDTVFNRCLNILSQLSDCDYDLDEEIYQINRILPYIEESYFITGYTVKGFIEEFVNSNFVFNYISDAQVMCDFYTFFIDNLIKTLKTIFGITFYNLFSVYRVVKMSSYDLALVKY